MFIAETADMVPETRYQVRVRSVGTLATAADTGVGSRAGASASRRTVAMSDWVFADRPFVTPENGHMPSQVQERNDGYQERRDQVNAGQEAIDAEARADEKVRLARERENDVMWNLSM